MFTGNGYIALVTDAPESGRLSRRRLLQLAGVTGGVLVAAGVGYGIDQAVTAGGPTKTAPRFVSAPSLDPPLAEVLVPSAGTAPGLVTVTPWNPSGQRGPLLLDDDAQPVWFRDVSPHSASNLQVQSYGGHSVLTWWEGRLLSLGYGEGQYRLFGTDYREVTTVRAGNGLSGDLHEFLITPEGTALFTAYRRHPADLTSVGGSERGVLLDSYMQEVEIASGRVLFTWQASKHIALNESYSTPPSGDTPYDFFHINSIDVDVDGNLIISARHTWTVYKISRQSGAVLWRLGGKKSSFKLSSNGRFAWQHDARVRPGNRISIFDDGGGATNVETRSRGMLLALDLGQMRADLVAEFYPDPSFVTTSQGNLQELGNGNTFIGWGEEPYFSEYGDRGELLFVGKIAPQGSYRSYRFPWSGHPTDAPAIAVQQHADGSAMVFASWNGATEVARWQVISGSSPHTLVPRMTTDRDGFETAVVLRDPGRYVAVGALDATGRTLGRSRTALL